MSTTINASTSVVLVSSSNGPFTVFFPPLSTIGRLITVRDNNGFVSTGNTITLSTINNASFGSAGNTLQITQPFGFITLTAENAGTYSILNTFAFPAGSTAAFVSNVTASTILVQNQLLLRDTVNFSNIPIVSSNDTLLYNSAPLGDVSSADLISTTIGIEAFASNLVGTPQSRRVVAVGYTSNTVSNIFTPTGTIIYSDNNFPFNTSIDGTGGFSNGGVDITNGGGLWIACGNNQGGTSSQNTGYIQWSLDGSYWNNSTGPSLAISQGRTRVFWANNLYHALGSNTDGGSNTILYSSDGKTWVASATTPQEPFLSGGGVGYGTGIAFGCNVWVATGVQANTIPFSLLWSANGSNWNQATTTNWNNTPGFAYDVAFNGSRFLAFVGDDAAPFENIAYSSDGKNWLLTSSAGNTNFNNEPGFIAAPTTGLAIAVSASFRRFSVDGGFTWLNISGLPSGAPSRPYWDGSTWWISIDTGTNAQSIWYSFTGSNGWSNWLNGGGYSNKGYARGFYAVNAQSNLNLQLISTVAGIEQNLTVQNLRASTLTFTGGVQINSGNLNIAIGNSAGQTNQAPYGFAVGYQAGTISQNNYATAVGWQAGAFNQSEYAVALGTIAGAFNQGQSAISIGVNAGYSNQSTNAISIGSAAGYSNQADYAVAIGSQAGLSNQGSSAVAIGTTSGFIGQGIGSIAIGSNAGQQTQGETAIAIGLSAGSSGQLNFATAIGWEAGRSNQGTSAVAIGSLTGARNQSNSAVAIGRVSGFSNQGESAVAIGNSSGSFSQGSMAIAIGSNAGSTSQGPLAVAIGAQAGENTQLGIAIGRYAGNNTQNSLAVAIGTTAGSNNQGNNSVAIGVNSGFTNQGVSAVAVGDGAGSNGQGNYAVALGAYAGFATAQDNTIILNASGNPLNSAQANSLFVDPIRNDATPTNVLFYNTTTKEISYGANSGGTFATFAGTASNLFTNSNYTVNNIRTGAANITLGTFAGNTSQGTAAIAIGCNAGCNTQDIEAVAIGIAAGAYLQQERCIAIGYYAGSNNQGITGIAIGAYCGSNAQQNNAVALGTYAGENTQNLGAVAIGTNAGRLNQGSVTVAIGSNAGSNTQASASIAIGFNTAVLGQAANCVAIGTEAGNGRQSTNSVAIGYQAGNLNQDSNSIAIGYQAGYRRQNINSIALGYLAGYSNQRSNSIAIGQGAGQWNQDTNAAAFGLFAGFSNQSNDCIALGRQAGSNSQKDGAVALGVNAGNVIQGTFGTALGAYTGTNNQGNYATAVGYAAGSNAQGTNAVAIGAFSGLTNQGLNSVAIGINSGNLNQGRSAIAIGDGACVSGQGNYGVAIGALAGFGTAHGSTIIINASGANLNSGGTNRFYVAPIRNANTFGTQMNYDSNTSEITYGTPSSDSNVKENIFTLSSTLEAVLALRPVEFNYKEQPSTLRRYGFIAQEVQPLFPYTISIDSTSTLGLDYNMFPPLLASAVQSLHSTNQGLQETIRLQQQQIRQLFSTLSIA